MNCFTNVKIGFMLGEIKTCFVSLLILFYLLTSASFATELGDITDFQEVDHYYEITCGQDKVRVIFYRDDIFRIWLAPNGTFTEPEDEGTPMVVYDGDPISAMDSDEGDYYKIESDACVLRINKTPCKFALYKKDNSTVIFEEERPIDYDDYDSITYQRIKKQSDEYYYGCGMKNGYYCHNGYSLDIRIGGGWNEGNHPNPAPFYMTTNGYGSFRNTFSWGTYNFSDSINCISLSHSESRFDAYYYVGSLKEILDGHTLITGRPFMPEYWHLILGDHNDFHRTQYYGELAIDMADEFLENDIPIGWFIPNDGYGLPWNQYHWEKIYTELSKRGIYLGSWFNFHVNHQLAFGEYGIKICKLDIGTLGGMSDAKNLDFNRELVEGIQEYGNGRGACWMTFCWAGSQRYCIPWSGDNSTGWNWLRWHIPTVCAGTMSGFNGGGTGFVDAIFGDGRDGLYTRDLQWKCWTPYMMVSGGWSARDWKEPFNSAGVNFFSTDEVAANRKALKLKSRINAYIYTLCHIAHTTGVGVVRPMVLEFPEDKSTWDGENNTLIKHQFMCGPHVLVAPVYDSNNTPSRSLYIPKGRWTNYWTGEIYDGANTINVSCENYTLPLLVREGAIIPMYPEMKVVSVDTILKQTRPRNPVTFDIYPHSSQKTSFTLYEDDGVSNDYKDGKYAETEVSCNPLSENGTVQIDVGATEGNYDSSSIVPGGKPEERFYKFKVHTRKDAENANIKTGTGDWVSLGRKGSIEAVDSANNGWYYESSLNGYVYIKTQNISADQSFSISIDGPTSINSPAYDNALLKSHLSTRGNKIYLNILKQYTGKIKVTVFDLRGRVIRHLPVDINKNKTVLVWDGCDKAGNLTSNGCYVIQLESEGKRFAKRMVISK